MRLTPINGLANRRLQPLGHPSAGTGAHRGSPPDTAFGTEVLGAPPPPRPTPPPPTPRASLRSTNRPTPGGSRNGASPHHFPQCASAFGAAPVVTFRSSGTSSV